VHVIKAGGMAGTIGKGPLNEGRRPCHHTRRTGRLVDAYNAIGALIDDSQRTGSDPTTQHRQVGSGSLCTGEIVIGPVRDRFKGQIRRSI
jgi:hypothetical protein